MLGNNNECYSSVPLNVTLPETKSVKLTFQYQKKSLIELFPYETKEKGNFYDKLFYFAVLE